MSQYEIFPYGNRVNNFPVQQPYASGTPGEPVFVEVVPVPSGALPAPAPQNSFTFHGEALARVPFLERAGGWIVFAFTAIFALFLVVMHLLGQVPGQSLILKSISDILQFVGECIGLIFCLIITVRLSTASIEPLHKLRYLETTPGHLNSELVAARREAQNARRAFWAWVFLSIAIAVYASGQAAWTSYDVRMPSYLVPYPGLYDIGFVSSYPFFLIGALLLTRQSKRSTVGRARLLLDAFAVIGAAMAISWFFVLSPTLAGLRSSPGWLESFTTVYFPGADLLLVAIGAFLMFSPLASREQQPVFVRLCLGLFFLAVTDSLLVWLSLSFSFNTGTLQDILWPLSLQMVGLAAIAFPQSAAREQARAAQLANRAGDLSLSITVSRFSSFTLALQTVAPFVLALGTCAVLLTVVSTTNNGSRLAASLIALALFVIVAVRQALTLNENNHLRRQLAGELVLSRRELQVTRREADEATREVQDKQKLEQGVVSLQAVHARIVTGDFSVRASTDPGPLQAVAVSFNLVIERLRDLAVRAGKYDQLVGEIRTLQLALDHLSQGAAAWPTSTGSNSRSELRPLFLSAERIQRFQLTQWRSLQSALERISLPVGRLRAALEVAEQSRPGNRNAPGSSDYTLAQLELQIQRLIVQTHSLVERLERQAPQAAAPGAVQKDFYQTRPEVGNRGFEAQPLRPQGRSSFEEGYPGNAGEAPRFPS